MGADPRQPASRIPRGVEILVNRAAVDPAFRELLLEERAGAAKAMGIRLDPAEIVMLRIVPREQLEGIISRTKVSPGLRSILLRGAATVTFAALGATGAGCDDVDSADDGMVAVEEYYASVKPVAPAEEPATDGIRPDPPIEFYQDSDGDLLPDDWETQHFGDIESEAGHGDADEDGFTNFAEYQAGTEPDDPSSTPEVTYGDADGDGLPDDWETERFGRTDLYGADDDPDGDAVRNIEEYYGASNPLDPSSKPLLAGGARVDVPCGATGAGSGVLGAGLAGVLAFLRRLGRKLRGGRAPEEGKNG